MAPPTYADLGKKASDLHSKGYHPGLLKFEAKTKTESGVKFTTGGQKDTESGKVVAGSEVTFAWPDYGLKYVEKWNTDNNLVVDMSIEDKLLEGLKTTFVSSFNPSTAKKKGTMKTSYKNDYVSGDINVDLAYAGPTINGSLVCGYKGWLAGYQMAFNTSKKALSANNFALGYDAGNHIVHGTVKNGQDVAGSYYHKVNSCLEAGCSVEWSSATKAAQGALAAKYTVSPDTSVKVKAALNGEVGMSLQQKINDSTSVTLSTLLDAKNFSAGGHRVGVSLDFEQ